MDVFDEGAIIIFISAEDDSLGKFIGANEIFFEALGYKDENIYGQTIEIFMPKHISLNHNEYLKKFSMDNRYSSWIKRTYALNK